MGQSMASGVEIASLFASIGAETSAFDRALKKVDSDMSLFEKGMGVVSAGVTATFAVAATAVAGLATGIGVAVKGAASMEQGIANIAASMQLGAEETGQLKDLIMDLGLDPKLKTTA